MPGDIANEHTMQQLISLAHWLIAENTSYTNYIHPAMYRKQMELTA
jgi:hypothetical protein